jgi:hypothetical protein
MSGKPHPLTVEVMAAALRAAATALDSRDAGNGDGQPKPERGERKASAPKFAALLKQRRARPAAEEEGEGGGNGPALRPRAARPQDSP